MKEDSYKNNLMPVDELNASLTPEERKANASKAGKASVEARRRRKTLREELTYLLNTTIKDKQGKEITINESITMALLNAANKGNVKAFEVIRDTIGEKPVERQEITGFINQSEASVEEVQEFREKLGIK